MLSMLQGEEELVRRAKAGDASALDTLIKASSSDLCCAIEARLSQSWRQLFLPEDVFQEAVTEAYRSFSSFQWRGPGSFLAWLKHIAMNDMRDEIRKLLAAKRAPANAMRSSSTDSLIAFIEDITDPGQSTPSRIVMRDEAIKLFWKAMTGLPVDQQEAVRLYDVDGMDIADVEAEMKIKRTHIHVLRFRAFARLRKALADQASILRYV